MNSKVSKPQFILSILIVFSISFISFFYYAYNHVEDSYKEINTRLTENINMLYDEAHGKMMRQLLKTNSKLLYNFTDKDDILKYLKNNNSKNREAVISMLDPFYQKLKNDVLSFHIMHLVDKNGKSLVRMHKKDKYGDDLRTFRPQIENVVLNPQVQSYYELGKYGLFFRFITPIYGEKELLGFFEIGMRPTALIKKIERIFDTKGYFFVKDIEENSHLKGLKTKGYVLCPFCSNEDPFIKGVADQIDFSKQNYTVYYKNKSYEVIKKDIYGLEQKSVAKVVFFKETTFTNTELKNLLFNGFIIFILSIFIIYFLFNLYIDSMLKKLNFSKFLLNNINDSVIVIDPKTKKILEVNERTELMLGYERSDLVEKDINKIKFSNENEKLIFDFSELREKRHMTLRTNSIKKDGSLLPVEASITYIKDNGKEYIISVGRDITDQIQKDKRIEKSNLELQRLHSLISESVLYTTSDLNGNITSVSKSFAKFTGFNEKEIVGKNHRIFKHPDMNSEYFKKMWEVLNENRQFRGEMKNRKRDGTPFWVQLTIDPIFDENNKKIGYASYRVDITDKKELEYISTHDQLTKLYNRHEFNKHIRTKVKTANRYGIKFGFIIFDVDHFKSINDTYGHHIGDLVLIKLSDAIKSLLREDDLIARWGGEEFVIVTVESTEKELAKLAQKIKEYLKTIDFSPVENVTVSFGLTIFKDGDCDKSVQKRADEALYMAKRNGRDRYELL